MLGNEHIISDFENIILKECVFEIPESSILKSLDGTQFFNNKAKKIEEE